MEACTEHLSVRFKQNAVTEFLTVEGVTADEKWVRGCICMNPKPKFGPSNTAANVQLRKKNKVKTEA
jgi:hypothetical protein